jgi:hypothetical protein
MKTTSRLVVIVLGIALGVLMVPAVGPARHTGGSLNPPPIALNVGDIVRVSGAPIGCIVRLQAKVKTLDCRRIGALPGTYGTLLNGQSARVVRFETASIAKIVFSAQHRRNNAHTCR